MRDRIKRAESLLMQEISRVILEDIHNPDIGFITLIRVEVAKDMKTARVYYSVLGDTEAKKKTEDAIAESSKEIKKIVNDRIKLRYAVDFRFIREAGFDNSFRVEQIISQIQKERETKDKPGDGV